MITAFMQIPEVDQYLKSFPRAQWQRCLELTITLGVQAAKKRFPYGVTLEALSRAVEKGTVDPSPDPEAMLEKLRKIKVDQQDPPDPSPETRANRKTVTPEKRAVRTETKPASSKQQPAAVEEKPRTNEGSRKTGDSRTRHHRVEEELRVDGPRAEQKGQSAGGKSAGKGEQGTRVAAASPPAKLLLEEDDLDAKETRIKPYMPKPQSTSTKKPKDSMRHAEVAVKSSNSDPPLRSALKAQAQGPLVEPRTNLAFVGKLLPPAAAGRKSKAQLEEAKEKQDPESSILKITDAFLADPFIALLSNQTSPKWMKDRR